MGDVDDERGPIDDPMEGVGPFDEHDGARHLRQVEPGLLIVDVAQAIIDPRIRR